MAKTSRPAAKPKHSAAPAAAPAVPEVDEERQRAFPIVGIGASAGGYEAFVQLLQTLPANTGMAFVFVVHLEPEHQSMLSKLLANVTAMPVTEAGNGTEVRPNHVYVIPPNSDMGIRSGVLQILVRRKTGGRYLPVDYFLSSLAEDRRGSAIGVILSGTGSDGTIGLEAIKAEGGITFAQDEETSKHHGMPGSAIAAGCVDFVLSPDRIGEELDQLARHPYVGLPQLPKLPELPPVGESDFRKILFLLRSTNGVDFTYYKPGTIRRRIARRMALLKIENLKKYLAHLQSNQAELDSLFQDILIHVTGFFREPEAFRILQTRVFSKIVVSKKPGEAIRIWAPGCSSGEEVYSLAIALLEFLGDRASSTPIQAFGTDISELSIERARAGTYAESSLREVSPVRLRRFFTRTEGGYRVSKALREMCVFARQDLTKDPPFSRIDLISCRNVLIYMGAALQKRVIAGFHYAMRDDGYLLLGKSEALTAYPDLFVAAERKGRIYAKKVSTRRPAPDFSPVNFEKAPLALPILEEAAFDPLKEADRRVWQRFAHAGLVLNENLEILHFRGDTSPFVSPAAGKASLHVLRMVKDELKMELRSAIYRTRKTNTPARSTGVRVRRNGRIREVNLEVEPLNRPGGKERYFLVLFDELGKEVTVPPVEKPGETRHRRGADDREVTQLRRELEASREYLQSVVEQEEASNEELKSANEEILSSNEELQSTNEELETAKEELQSTNEELVTLNETLQIRNAELAKLSDDLTNVLDGANVPILIVGQDGRIRRFTASAESLLNLLPADVGRPIGNIRPNVEIPDLEAVVGQVSRTFAELQREVRDQEGRWYILRIRPYRTAENKIDGVLMAFLEIDALKRVNQALGESEAMVRGLVETLVLGILVIDASGKLVMVNAAAEAMFGYHRDELLGQPLEVLLPQQLRAAHAEHRAAYLAAPKIRLMGSGLEIGGCRKDGSEFPAEVGLSYVQTSGALLAVASVVDISERRKTEVALAEKEGALRLSDQQLQMFTASLLTAQEEERERLAGELHDDLNQRLAALAMQAAALEQSPDSATSVRDQIRGFRLTIEALSEEVRRLAHQLHPTVLEHFGLAKALDSYCEEFSRLKELRIRFRQRDVPEAVPQEVALCLYRIAQEALANVARHSGAKTASVVLAGAAGRIHLAVSDNGVGFDADAARPGLGLVSMRERIRLVGGTLSIKTRPGDGSRIEVSIPLARQPT
jgi:two-component system CheB/CheR fusion protein